MPAYYRLIAVRPWVEAASALTSADESENQFAHNARSLLLPLPAGRRPLVDRFLGILAET